MVLATSLFSEAALRFVLLGARHGCPDRARRPRHRPRLPGLRRPELQRRRLRRHRRLLLLRHPGRCPDRGRRRRRPRRRGAARARDLRRALARSATPPGWRSSSPPSALFSAGQAFMILRWGLGVVQPESMLPTRNVTLWGDLRIGLDRLRAHRHRPRLRRRPAPRLHRARCSAWPRLPWPRTGGWRRAPAGRPTASSWSTSPSPVGCRPWPPSSSPPSSRSTPPCCRSPSSRRSPPPSSGGSRRSASPSAPPC